jgi:hypothetical protein
MTENMMQDLYSQPPFELTQLPDTIKRQEKSKML